MHPKYRHRRSLPGVTGNQQGDGPGKDRTVVFDITIVRHL